MVPIVLPFVTENIGKNTSPEDWRLREAATFAFGSILEGPSPRALADVVRQGMGFLLAVSAALRTQQRQQPDGQAITSSPPNWLCCISNSQQVHCSSEAEVSLPHFALSCGVSTLSPCVPAACAGNDRPQSLCS